MEPAAVLVTGICELFDMYFLAVFRSFSDVALTNFAAEDALEVPLPPYSSLILDLFLSYWTLSLEQNACRGLSSLLSILNGIEKLEDHSFLAAKAIGICQSSFILFGVCIHD